MTSKSFEELYSELNSMNTQDIKHALEEASKNLKKCTAPFEVRDIVEQQQSEIERLNNLKRFEKFIDERIHTDKVRGLTWEFKTKEERDKAFEKELEKLFDIATAKSEAVKEFAERFLKKVHDNHYLLSDRNNSKDYGMFTVGIEQAVNETKEEMVGDIE